ncbi:CopD family copper resistance protein [Pseudomonas sp. NY15435]|uniref:CopD family copper resistance protein n=1 Tax=Pseudomonas sp. NY15435 TaxID=3400358 RepID=UPI003A8BE277
MAYPVLLVLHLFAAIMFVGTVFFEVLILESVHHHVPARAMRMVDGALGRRLRRVMPWVILTLFGSGLGMLHLRYAPLLVDPLATSFATLLSLKLLLAASVLGHFIFAMYSFRVGRMTGQRSRRIHYSVFAHVVLIVLLAKGMFYLSW